MDMKWKNAVFSLLLSVSLGTAAQTTVPPSTAAADTVHTDSTIIQTHTIKSVYQRRMEKRVHRWQRLIPSHYKAQFAGSIGAGSLGFGWTYGKHDQWETDIMLGILPKANSDKAKAVLTIREEYVPWRIRLGRSDFAIRPLTCALFFSSVLDNDFWVREPDRYPKGYYGFSTRLRANLSLGQRISYYFPEKSRTYARGISLYYELGVCDTDVITFCCDRCIPFKEILSLAIGVKVHL